VNKISINKSRTGEPTAAIGTFRIHSSYNPDKEARGFLNKRVSEIKRNSTIAIIGAGLGYLDRSLKSSMPNSKIISIHLDSDLYHNRVSSPPIRNSVYRWHPGMSVDIETFLLKTLHESDVKGLKIISWYPSIKARLKLANEVSNAFGLVMRRYAGNVDTTATFGRLWIRNILRNFMNLKEFIVPMKLKQPIVLAASGPSLEYALKELHKHRYSFQLWALPSALPVLTGAKLEPDLIVASDPGYWALQHQRFYAENVPIAMPLSSSTPPPNSRVLLLNQGTAVESKLIKSEEWPGISVPSMGTVAATAVEVWRCLSEGPLILVGLDLCWFDLRSHSRPHAFDGWITSKSCRLRPFNDIYWKRTETFGPVRLGKFRVGSALATYADWFGNNLPKDRVFRFAPEKFAPIPVKLPGITEVGPEIFAKYLETWTQDDKFDVFITQENKNQRRFLILCAFERWKQLINQEFTDNEICELMYTLDARGFIELKNCAESERSEKEVRHRNAVKQILSSLEKPYI